MGRIDMEEFLPRFLARHSKDLRFPEIETYVKSLKQEHGFKKVGAIGFCWGGWAVFQLGAKGTATRQTANVNYMDRLTLMIRQESSRLHLSGAS